MFFGNGEMICSFFAENNFIKDGGFVCRCSCGSFALGKGVSILRFTRGGIRRQFKGKSFLRPIGSVQGGLPLFQVLGDLQLVQGFVTLGIGNLIAVFRGRNDPAVVTGVFPGYRHFINGIMNLVPVDVMRPEILKGIFRPVRVQFDRTRRFGSVLQVNGNLHILRPVNGAFVINPFLFHMNGCFVDYVPHSGAADINIVIPLFRVDFGSAVFQTVSDNGAAPVGAQFSDSRVRRQQDTDGAFLGLQVMIIRFVSVFSGLYNKVIDQSG